MGEEETIAFLLQAHSPVLPSPQQCLLLHARMVSFGLDQKTHLANVLLHRYAKSMEISNASVLFNKIHERDVVSWNTMMGAYANAQDERHHSQAVPCHVQKVQPHPKEEPHYAQKVSVHAGESLSYAQESLGHAQEVSHHLQEIQGDTQEVPHHAKQVTRLSTQEMSNQAQRVLHPSREETQHIQKALEMFTQMETEGVSPDRVTFIICLKACSRATSLVEGEHVHTLAVGAGCDTDIMVATGLIDMYGRCRDVDQAKIVFSKVSVALDVAAYNSLMGAFVRKGRHHEALRLLSEMWTRDVKPNTITFINALSACVAPENLRDGKFIHTCISDDLLESNVVLRNALMTMYGKCGDPTNARIMFGKVEKRNVVSWTSMITECTRQGCNREALDYFYQMQEQGVEPDKVTFISALSACASLESMAEGKEIHALVTYKGFELDVITGTALVNMYGKCKLLDDALAAFNNITQQTVISWNAIITVYAQQGLGHEALELFRKMQQEEGMEPDKVTFIGILTACACIGALDEGIAIHNHIADLGLESDFVISNAIVNMYGKCAALQKAQSVFDNMHNRNVVTWTALITAYAQQGHGSEALNLYKKMQEEKVMPNATTFLSLISACSHAGLVDEGLFYFSSMRDEHGIEPTYEHYGSMVDLLGRAGLLTEAEDFISKMPMEADACVWTSLLGACRMHGDMERAKRAAENVVYLEGNNASAYVLLFNMYALDGKENDMERIRKMMRKRGIDKQLGCSLI